MYGAPEATLLVVTDVALDQRVINALESAAQALGHDEGACIATCAELAGDPAAFIATCDPWAVVAIDEPSEELLKRAFPPESQALRPDAPVAVPEGYLLVSVPEFAQCLDDLPLKRIAWNRLKAARHPGNPLERQRPSS